MSTFLKESIYCSFLSLSDGGAISLFSGRIGRHAPDGDFFVYCSDALSISEGMDGICSSQTSGKNDFQLTFAENVYM